LRRMGRCLSSPELRHLGERAKYRGLSAALRFGRDDVRFFAELKGRGVDGGETPVEMT